MTVVEARRPKLVTLVGVLVVIAGILDIVLGIVWLFYKPDGDATNNLGPVLGIAFLVIGIVQVSVARGLFQGSSRARSIVAFVIAFDIAVSTFALTAGNNPRALSFTDILFAIVIIVILYTPKANAFFGAQREAVGDAAHPSR
ncbi:MAG: hypothetical protein ABJA89_18155 [Lapillicoccus sp.]